MGIMGISVYRKVIFCLIVLFNLMLIASIKVWADAPGTVSIVSNPPEVKIYLDDFYKGLTPITLVVPTREHTITATKEDYLKINQGVSLASGETINLAFNLIESNLSQESGILLIKTTPNESDVFLDYEPTPRGKTPLIISKLVTGNHNVRLSKQGHQDAEANLNIQKNVMTELDIILQPMIDNVSQIGSSGGSGNGESSNSGGLSNTGESSGGEGASGGEIKNPLENKNQTKSSDENKNYNKNEPIEKSILDKNDLYKSIPESSISLLRVFLVIVVIVLLLLWSFRNKIFKKL